MSGIPFEKDERDESCADMRINASCDHVSEVCIAYASLHNVPCALIQRMRGVHNVRLAYNRNDSGSNGERCSDSLTSLEQWCSLRKVRKISATIGLVLLFHLQSSLHSRLSSRTQRHNIDSLGCKIPRTATPWLL
jgi:hypothetical protein